MPQVFSLHVCVCACVRVSWSLNVCVCVCVASSVLVFLLLLIITDISRCKRQHCLPFLSLPLLWLSLHNCGYVPFCIWPEPENPSIITVFVSNLLGQRVISGNTNVERPKDTQLQIQIHIQLETQLHICSQRYRYVCDTAIDFWPEKLISVNNPNSSSKLISTTSTWHCLPSLLLPLSHTLTFKLPNSLPLSHTYS